MSVLDVMKEHGLLGWYTLLVGLEHGWAKKEDLIDYAETELRASVDTIDDDLLALATGEDRSEADLRSIGLRRLSEQGQPLSNSGTAVILDQWRFAHLLWLLRSDLSDQGKMDKLQELYAEFGFPQDMASCSIYSNDGVDPLVAAQCLINDLSEKIKGRGRSAV